MIESRLAGYSSPLMVELVAGRLRRARKGVSRWAVAGAALALLIAVAGTFALVRAYLLRDAVLPGVTVGMIDVGGLPRDEAAAPSDFSTCPRRPAKSAQSIWTPDV